MQAGRKKEDDGSSMKIVGRLGIAVVLSVIVVGLFLQMGRKPEKHLYKETRSSLYTLVTVTVVADSPEKARKATADAYDELDRLGRLLNFYAEDSELSAINRNAGIKPVHVSRDTLEIIKTAVMVGEQTEGGFDVTVGPIVKLWDFKKKTRPSASAIAEKLPSVGYENIVVDEVAATVFLKNPGIQLDLGGIIKGFAADKAVQSLKANGIKLFGRQPDGRPWNIGIQNPRAEGDKDELFATVNLGTQGISTSGDYQRYFILDGIRYHHLLNPKTGYPESLCRSVTVIAPEAALTDAYATGIFIMGPQKGLAVLERLGMDGVIIDREGQVLMTKGIRDKVHLLKTE